MGFMKETSKSAFELPGAFALLLSALAIVGYMLLMLIDGIVAILLGLFHILIGERKTNKKSKKGKDGILPIQDASGQEEETLLIKCAPGGEQNPVLEDMLTHPHLLIAGATGSGKSVLVNGLIKTLLESYTPDECTLVLIDPKRVELSLWADAPHTVEYASEPHAMIEALQYAMWLVEARYEQMQVQGVRKYQGAHTYVFIDELADLMTTQQKAVQPLLQRLCQIGRAANVHVVACTQCPLREILPTAIKVNFDARVGLHTRSAQDSRNILDENGCEDLPPYGYGLYMSPGKGLTSIEIPFYPDDVLECLVEYWEDWDQESR